MDRESMEFDILIVGGGPAGLAAACKLMILASEHQLDISVCLIEKGSEIGAHTLSGAILETRSLDELFPMWKDMDAPLNTPVSKDEMYIYLSRERAIRLPQWMIPKPMHNEGNYIVSMGNVCRWLAEQAESSGVEVYPGFSASEILYNEDGSVEGVIIGDMGLSAAGEPKDSYMKGMELRAKYTIFAEGCRGHLGKEIISKFMKMN